VAAGFTTALAIFPPQRCALLALLRGTNKTSPAIADRARRDRPD
jgi:hypothetical protein